MPTFLETVVEHTRKKLEKRRAAVSEAELRERLGPVPRGRPFSEALIAEGISLIAEMKRSSPSKGPIRPDAGVTEIVTAYQDAGASAVSVLTEPKWFGGSLDDLIEARAALHIPILRKDFIVDPYQLVEARVAGADAALLIVAALGRKRLAELMQVAHDLGLDCLVEVERYSHVMHIESSVVGELAEGRRPCDALRATFPAGTLSGAPKVRAMEIIDEMEPTKRGTYGGAVGFVGFDGDLDTCITIRTIACKDGRIHVQAGAGIVADSVPATEYEETQNKARAMFRAIEVAAGQGDW